MTLARALISGPPVKRPSVTWNWPPPPAVLTGAEVEIEVHRRLRDARELRRIGLVDPVDVRELDVVDAERDDGPVLLRQLDRLGEGRLWDEPSRLVADVREAFREGRILQRVPRPGASASPSASASAASSRATIDSGRGGSPSGRLVGDLHGRGDRAAEEIHRDRIDDEDLSFVPTAQRPRIDVHEIVVDGERRVTERHVEPGVVATRFAKIEESLDRGVDGLPSIRWSMTTVWSWGGRWPQLSVSIVASIPSFSSSRSSVSMSRPPASDPKKSGPLELGVDRVPAGASPEIDRLPRSSWSGCRSRSSVRRGPCGWDCPRSRRPRSGRRRRCGRSRRSR